MGTCLIDQYFLGDSTQGHPNTETEKMVWGPENLLYLKTPFQEVFGGVWMYRDIQWYKISDL